jgi:hypothetical protein
LRSTRKSVSLVNEPVKLPTSLAAFAGSLVAIGGCSGSSPRGAGPGSLDAGNNDAASALDAGHLGSSDSSTPVGSSDSSTTVFGGDAVAPPSTGDGGPGCPIATLGIPGVYGSGDVFMAWLMSQGESSSGNLDDQVLTPALLRPYKIVVAQDLSKNHAYSASEVSALSAWVNAGGGLMTLIGYQPTETPPEPTNVNALVAPYSMSYGFTAILPNVGITDWVHPHPVTQGITDVGFENGFAVQGSGTMLASGQGYEVLEVQNVGSGHVLMWGDEWITYDAFWTMNPQYQVQLFWQNIVNWMDPGGGCQVPNPPQ